MTDYKLDLDLKYFDKSDSSLTKPYLTLYIHLYLRVIAEHMNMKLRVTA